MKYTKSFKAILLSAVLLCSLTSCGNKDNNSGADKLGKMEVEIPEPLKDDPEIVEYIEGMSKVVDEYALLMDGMLEEMGELAGRDWDELKVREQIKLTTVATKFAMKSAPITARWAELEANRNVDEEGLNEEELLALETLLDRFEARMAEIEARNAKYFSDVEE